jgi:integrase
MQEALMASLELRNMTYRVVFMLGGRKYGYSLETGEASLAEALRGGVRKTLMLMGQGLLKLPEGVDVVEFVKSGGQLVQQSTQPNKRPGLKAVIDEYTASFANGSIEENSLATIRLHLNHLVRHFGERFDPQTFALGDLQRYVDTRAKKRYRGRPLSPVTLRKEIATIRACWNWATRAAKVSGEFPGRGLRYPKGEEKPPFQTFAQIEQRVAHGGMTQREVERFWECLFLTLDEVKELLKFVKAQAAHSWVYPAFCFAAHTGARRSEILRLELSDVDLEAGTALVREKKRSRGQRTTRRVPLSDFLVGVLREWLAEHPGGRYLFCHREVVARSKKRSSTTGHQAGSGRATSQKGRLATLRPRHCSVPTALTRDEAHDHFTRTLAAGKWRVLRGWHVLRHSFISNCAAKGIDQRLIDDWVGHTTEEMRKRYRHLIPSVERKAIRTVFG